MNGDASSGPLHTATYVGVKMQADQPNRNSPLSRQMKLFEMSANYGKKGRNN